VERGLPRGFPRLENREREISGADEEEQEFLEMMEVLAGMAEEIKKKLSDDQKKKNKE
jgi:hypothetical protein